MLRCGIVLLTLIALTLGTPPLSFDKATQTSDSDLTQDAILSMGDVCILGGPSFMCHFRCNEQNLRAVCDVDRGLCVCIPPGEAGAMDEESQSEELSTKTPLIISSGGEGNETSANDDSIQHMIFYIFDLGSLFGGDNDTVVNVTDIPSTNVPMEDVNANLEVEKMRGWASTHVLAMIIVGLLCVLILVELVACLKKQKAKQKEANLFTNSLGIPNKS